MRLTYADGQRKGDSIKSRLVFWRTRSNLCSPRITEPRPACLSPPSQGPSWTGQAEPCLPCLTTPGLARPGHALPALPYLAKPIPAAPHLAMPAAPKHARPSVTELRRALPAAPHRAKHRTDAPRRASPAMPQSFLLRTFLIALNTIESSFNRSYRWRNVSSSFSASVSICSRRSLLVKTSVRIL
jgi:hypothetical protein